jgi:mannose-6-phosphate isomerase-like protein (cupin superfamily)
LDAEHYKWGGPTGIDCDGWHLLRTPELSIIEEAMPSGASETRHYHRHARQFFYVIEGELTLEIEHESITLNVGDGAEIAPTQAHQAINRSGGTTRFLVTSQPPATATASKASHEEAPRRRRGNTESASPDYLSSLRFI